MRVLILGGTGSIGRGIVRALLRRGHDAVALARSRQSADRLALAGATPLPGDLREIDNWLPAVEKMDGVIHAAATWDEDMAAIDRRVVETLIPAMSSYEPPKAFIYTGGTWKYGNTGDSIAKEESPTFDIKYFVDTVKIEELVLSAPGVRGMVIHPAMVYEDEGGIFDHMYDDARHLGYIRVIGGEDIRWPLVHHDDLGELYTLMIERGHAGDVLNGCAITGCPIGTIARAIAMRMNVPDVPKVLPVSDAVLEFGPWAEGYALDQQVSGEKAMKALGWNPKHRDAIADIAGR